MADHDKLAEGELGIFESIVMGVAGTAPAFSVAATTTALVAAVGTLSAASILYCGFIMFGITLAFMHLNRTDPNAGASYIWVGRTFGPMLGFFAGWSLLVASTIFMVSATIPAATATLLLAAPAHAGDPRWATAVAAGWLIAVSAVIMKGIKITSITQVVMTAIEVTVLVIMIAASFAYFGSHPVHALGLREFLPSSFTPEQFTSGALIALFFFWGWDVVANLNEETRDAAQAAGQAAFWSMVIVLLLFIAFVAAVLIALTDDEVRRSSTNIVVALADKIFPRPWSYIAVLAVILSTVGTLETSILQFTRSLFAQARAGALHPRYAKLHSRWHTPCVATLVIAGVGLVLLLLSSALHSINAIIDDSINVIGFQVAFYYSLTGLACAWHYRDLIRKSLREAILLVAWPAASAGFLVFIAVYRIQAFDAIINILGIGGIAIGAIPFVLGKRRRQDAGIGENPTAV